MSYLNSNGLVGGCIPAGEPCQFYGMCYRRNEFCPSEGNRRDIDLSCALARGLSCVRYYGNKDIDYKPIT